VLTPLFVGGASVLMSPAAFLQRPIRWLRAIQDRRGTISGAPNFAYEYCVRRVSTEDRAGLDLSSWRLAFCGAEPVRADTLRDFADAYESTGFNPRAFYPCYGLAEATLLAAGGDHDDNPTLLSVDRLTGTIAPNPDAVRLIKAFTDGLVQASVAVREIQQSLQFEDALRAATLIGQVIGAAADLLSQVVIGVTQGLGDVARVFQVVGEAFGAESVRDAREFARVLARIITVAVSFQLVVGAIGSAFTALVFPAFAVLGIFKQIVVASSIASQVFLGISGLLGTSATVLGGILASALAINAAAVFLLDKVRDLLSELTGIPLTLVETATIFSGLLIDRFVRFTNLVFGFFGQVPNAAKTAFALVRLAVIPLIEEIVDLLDDTLAGKILGRIIPGGIDTVRATLSGMLDDARSDLDDAKASAEGFRDTIKQAFEAPDPQGIRAGIRGVVQGLRASTNAPDGVGLQDIFSTQAESLLDGLFDDLELPPGLLEESESLLDVYESLSPIVQRAATTLEDLGSTSERIKDDILRASTELAKATQTVGLEGGARRIAELQIQRQADLREKSKKFVAEEVQATERLASVRARMAQQAARMNALTREERDAVDTIRKRFERLTEVQSELSRLEVERVVAQRQLGRALRDGQTKAAEEARDRVIELDDAIESVQAKQNAYTKSVEFLEEDYRAAGLEVFKLANLARDRIGLASEEETIQQKLLDISRERARLETLLQTATSQRVAALATQSAFELGQESRSRAISLARERFDLQNRYVERQAREVAQARLSLQAARAELSIFREQAERQQRAAQTQVESAANRLKGLRLAKEAVETDQRREEISEAIVSAEQEVSALKKLQNQVTLSNTIAQEELNNQLAEASRLLQEQRRQAEQPLRFGLMQGLRQFAQEAPTIFEQTVSLVNGTLTRFASTASSTIADIFDPNSNTNIQESIGRFVQDLGRQLLEAVVLQLIRQLILATGLLKSTADESASKLLTAAVLWGLASEKWEEIADKLFAAAVLNAAFGGDGEGGGGIFGLASGGPVDGEPVPARSRPRGVHHSDRIPIMAAAGEFMLRAKAARAIGHDVLDRINRGLVDPMSLRALAGLESVHRSVSSRPRAGMASGGSVAVSSRSRGGDGPPGGGLQVLPVLVADEGQARSILRAGERTLISMMDSAGFRR